MEIEYRFRKIYALVPEDLYIELKKEGWFGGRFDAVVTELLWKEIEKTKQIHSNQRLHGELKND